MFVIRLLTAPAHVGVEFTEQSYSHFHELTNIWFFNIKHLKVNETN